MEIHDGRESVTWSVHPARERPVPAALAGAAILTLALLCARLGEHPLWGLLALICLFVALNRFFLPSRFTIAPAGLTARHPLRRRHLRWQEVRRFVHDRRGGYLSTRAHPSRLDAFTGIHLLFPVRDGVLRRVLVARIRAHVDDRPGTRERTAAPAEPLIAVEESATCSG
jgi:hypothetical protein